MFDDQVQPDCCRGRPAAGQLVATTLALLALASAGGCGQPAGTIFDAATAGPVWPPPPDAARIRYIGQIATDSDLKPAKSGWTVLGEALGGSASARRVSTPAGIAVSDAGRLYVADPAVHAVHVFDTQTRQYQAISEAGEQALFTPADVAVGGADVFVSDSALHAIFVYDGAGRFVRAFGVGQLKRPVGLAWWQPPAASAPAGGGEGKLFVVDTGAHAVVVFDASGREVSRFGRRGSGDGEFNHPTDVAVHARTGVVVADTLNFRVQRFTPEGAHLATLGARGDGAGSFALPKGVAVDREGRIYVVDAQFENVQIFNPDGQLLLAFGREGRKPGEFWLPGGAAIGADDRLWIADGYNRRVQVFQLLPEPGGPPTGAERQEMR